MVQAVDGNWYAYFGDSTAVAAADGETTFDFGTDGTPTVGLGDFDEQQMFTTKPQHNQQQL